MLASLKNSKFVPLIDSRMSVAEQATELKEHERDVATWVKRMNACLYSNDEAERWIGISLLYETTSLVTLESFSMFCTSWTKSAAALLSKDGPSTAIACMNVLQRTLEYAHKDAELRRNLATDFLPGILTSLLSIVKSTEVGVLNSQLQSSAFNTVSICAQTFAGPTRLFLEKFKKACLKQFDSRNNNVAEAAAKCFALLPVSASAKSQADTWFNTCVELLGACHQIIGNVYKGVDEEDIWGSVSFQSAKLSVLDEGDMVDTLHTRSRRLRYLQLSLQKLISSPFNCAVVLPIDAILGLVARILAADAKTFQTTRSHTLLKSILPTIFLDALKTLTSLMESAQHHLTSRCAVVERIITQTLRSESHTTRSEPVTANKMAVYALIEKMVCYLGPVIEPVVLQDIIDSIIGDAQSNANVVDSFTPSTSTYQSRVPGGDVHSNNVKLCVSSLNALSSILIVSGREMTPSSHVTIANFLLGTTMKFGLKFPGVYSDHRCRFAIYNTFRTFLLAEIPPQPTCKPHSVTVFSFGLQDSNESIRKLCQESLSFLDQLVHPVIGSIPRKAKIQQQQQQQKDEEKQKQDELQRQQQRQQQQQKDEEQQKQ